MIISNAIVLKTDNIAKTCWARLRRFHNINYVVGLLNDIHCIPAKHRENVKKQAQQIKYCLIQAKEYADAAGVVGLATAPTLFYYSTMSLALAEILLKQDGGSSLDAARGQNAHHGLEFSLSSLPNLENQTLPARASALRAKPLIRRKEISPGECIDERFGTFELWHKSARESPLVGKMKERIPNSLNTIEHEAAVLFQSNDVRMPLVPREGIDMLECFSKNVSMMQFNTTHLVTPSFARIKVSKDINIIGEYLEVIIHPGDSNILNSLYENITINPNDIDMIDITEFPSGVRIQMNIKDSRRVRCIFPHGTSITNEISMMFDSDWPLNEFGNFYVSLFIAGNYARYYPDQWLYEIDHATPFALAIEELLKNAFDRVPLLTLGELGRQYIAVE